MVVLTSLLIASTWTSSHFVLEGDCSPNEATALLDQLERARGEVLGVMGESVASTDRARSIDVWLAPDTQAFVQRSGRPWHNGAAYVRRRLMLQPLSLLQRYHDLDATLRHEIAHVWLERYRAPAWIIEGLAMHIAGDKPRGPLPEMPARAELERGMAAKSRRESELAYGRAYRAVAAILDTHGLHETLQMLARGKLLVTD